MYFLFYWSFVGLLANCDWQKYKSNQQGNFYSIFFSVHMKTSTFETLWNDNKKNAIYNENMMACSQTWHGW